MPHDPSYSSSSSPYSVRLDIPANDVDRVVEWVKANIPRRWNYKGLWLVSMPSFTRETLYFWFEDAADAVLFHLHFR